MSRYVFLIVFLLFSNSAFSAAYFIYASNLSQSFATTTEACEFRRSWLESSQPPQNGIKFEFAVTACTTPAQLDGKAYGRATIRRTSTVIATGFTETADYSYNFVGYSLICPSGQEQSPVAGAANECVPVCPVGTVRNELGICEIQCGAGYFVDPDNPALCAHDCPTGAEPNAQGSCACPSSSISFMDSNNNLQGCSEPDPEEDNCKTAWDVISKFECGKKKEECEAQGGTFGFVNEKSTCLPAGFGDDLPTCEQGYVIADYGNGAGGVVCGSANKPPVTPPNNPNAHAPVTGDGSKNHDGIGNNTNGDGGAGSGSSETVCKSNPNLSPNDPACTAKETKSNNSSNGGSGCGQPPSCSGDPILCNILKQSYENKCALNTFDPSTLGTQDTAEGLQEEVDIEDTIAGIFEDDGVTSACPPPVTFRFTSTPFSYRPMCDLAEYIRPFVIMIFSYFAARLIHRSMMEI